MKFSELRQAVIDTITTNLPDLKAVEAHPGRFNLQELKRIATKLPAVRVALMGMPATVHLDTGEKEVKVRLAAFIITGDKRQLQKDEAALAIVESLLVLVLGQRWGITGTTAAKNVKADNLFSGNVERQGVAMWAVTWEQTIRTGEDVWGGGILPSRIYVNDDPQPAVGESDYRELTA